MSEICSSTRFRICTSKVRKLTFWRNLSWVLTMQHHHWCIFLPKHHKQNMPLRPISTDLNGPTRNRTKMFECSSFKFQFEFSWHWKFRTLMLTESTLLTARINSENKNKVCVYKFKIRFKIFDLGCLSHIPFLNGILAFDDENIHSHCWLYRFEMNFWYEW